MQGRLGITLLACALLLAAFVTAVGRLTAGFEHWTFEGLRRQAAANGEMHFPAMELIDSSGRPLRFQAGGNGQVMLVDFIYTSCESVCQSLGVEFFQAQQQIQQDASGVRLLSVSVDPLRDTPPALTAYGKRHRADERLWTLAAPGTADDGQQARRKLGVIAVADGSGGFAHNGALHVVDRSGRLAGIFDTTEWQRALALAKQLDEARP